MLHFLQNELEETSIVDNIMKLLHYYKLLDKFLRISKVEDEEQCEKQTIEFKINLLIYQEAASTTICTSKTMGNVVVCGP